MVAKQEQAAEYSEEDLARAKHVRFIVEHMHEAFDAQNIEVHVRMSALAVLIAETADRNGVPERRAIALVTHAFRSRHRHLRDFIKRMLAGL